MRRIGLRNAFDGWLSTLTNSCCKAAMAVNFAFNWASSSLIFSLHASTSSWKREIRSMTQNTKHDIIHEWNWRSWYSKSVLDRRWLLKCFKLVLWVYKRGMQLIMACTNQTDCILQTIMTDIKSITRRERSRESHQLHVFQEQNMRRVSRSYIVFSR